MALSTPPETPTAPASERSRPATPPFHSAPHRNSWTPYANRRRRPACRKNPAKVVTVAVADPEHGVAGAGSLPRSCFGCDDWDQGSGDSDYRHRFSLKFGARVWEYRAKQSPRGSFMLMRTAGALSLVMAMHVAIAQEGPMGPLRPDQTAFFALYKELVEINTTLSAGSCTAAAERIAAHLKAAGFEDKDITLFSVPEHPKEGGVVAVLAGTSRSAKPMLLLGHLDVVEAKREDWARDPFTLIEENGYFYGRGSSDMKAMDATWIDALMRFKHDGYHPNRTIKMALTCGEETTYAFNGAEWLAKTRPELISSAFALNEGGGGRTDGHGKLVVESIQVGEKAAQNYQLETTNAGGHSSIPIRDNAIYELADALAKVRDHEFSVKFTDTTRAFWFGAMMSAAKRFAVQTAVISSSSAGTSGTRSRKRRGRLRSTCSVCASTMSAIRALSTHSGP